MAGTMALAINNFETFNMYRMKLTISIIQLFIFFQTYSQVSIRNMSLVKPDSNVLFKQMDNKLKVLGTDQSVNIFSQNGASVSSYDSNTFLIKPKIRIPDTLLVFAGQKLLLKKVFIIDTLPELSVQLGNIQGDSATIGEIIANKVLMAGFKGSLYYYPIRVISFSTTFVGPAPEMQDNIRTVHGNMLSNEQVDIIKQLKKNSKILFDDILAVGSDTITRRLSPFAISIR